MVAAKTKRQKEPINILLTSKGRGRRGCRIHLLVNVDVAGLVDLWCGCLLGGSMLYYYVLVGGRCDM
jgi:hypothetical protein